MFQTLAAGSREPVILGLAVVPGDTPFRGDEPLLLQFDQGRIDSSIVNRQAIAADLLDPAGDAVAVQRANRVQGLQNHQGKRALPDVRLLFHIGTQYDYSPLILECNRNPSEVSTAYLW